MIASVITAAGLILVAAIGVYGNYLTAKIGKSVNGRMTEILDLTRKSSKEDGNREGRAQKKEEQAPVNAANIEAAEARGKLAGKAEEKEQNENK